MTLHRKARRSKKVEPKNVFRAAYKAKLASHKKLEKTKTPNVAKLRKVVAETTKKIAEEGFITVRDSKNDRSVTLKTQPDGTLRLLGKLSHQAELEFAPEEAKKLMKFLRKHS